MCNNRNYFENDTNEKRKKNSRFQEVHISVNLQVLVFTSHYSNWICNLRKDETNKHASKHKFLWVSFYGKSCKFLSIYPPYCYLPILIDFLLFMIYCSQELNWFPRTLSFALYFICLFTYCRDFTFFPLSNLLPYVFFILLSCLVWYCIRPCCCIICYLSCCIITLM